MRVNVWPVLFAVGVVLAGCSSGNRCTRACKKISQCYGDAGGAPTCTLSASCTPAEECQAVCINNASCDAIMGTDAPGQKALQSCITQCASKPPPVDQGVVLPEGSVPFDGPLPVYDFPPQPDFFVPPPDTGPSGPPVGKFCNDVLLGGNNFTATFTVGSGASKVTFTAYSGECSPKKGLTCQQIPTGSNLAVEVTDGTQALLSGTITQSVNQGEEWLFILTVDSATSEATLQGGPFKPGNACSATDPFIP